MFGSKSFSPPNIFSRHFKIVEIWKKIRNSETDKFDMLCCSNFFQNQEA